MNHPLVPPGNRRARPHPIRYDSGSGQPRTLEAIHLSSVLHRPDVRDDLQIGDERRWKRSSAIRVSLARARIVVADPQTPVMAVFFEALKAGPRVPL